MNENEETAKKAVESAGLAIWRAYCEKKEELEDIEEKFQLAIWWLREAAEELGRIRYPDKNYPLTSIEHFLEENDK